MPQPNPLVQASSPDDRVGPQQTIYDASLSTIFWRNFLAGMARALGGIVIQIVFLALMALLIINWLWPQVQPVITTYQKAVNSLDSLQQTTEKFGLLDSSQQSNQPTGDQFTLDKGSLNQLLESWGKPEPN